MNRYQESDEDVIQSYQAYRRAKGLPVGREGGNTPCTVCGGIGCRVKRIPLLGIKVARVCKACGGVGYIEK